MRKNYFQSHKMDIAGAYSYFGSNSGMELCLQEK